MNPTGWFQNQARLLGKSARTRARLMDAAVGLFARDGFEATSVNEIAKVAEVANGTFYVHFREKDEIAAAVALTMAQEVVRQLDAAMVDVEDAMERTSLATRRFIELAARQPIWGQALFRAIWRFPDLHEGVLTYLRADLERGARQGSFQVTVDEVLIDTFASMTLGAVYGRIQGTLDDQAGARVAELQLRMLGVPPDQARAVAWRPITPLDLGGLAEAGGSAPEVEHSRCSTPGGAGPVAD